MIIRFQKPEDRTVPSFPIGLDWYISAGRSDLFTHDFRCPFKHLPHAIRLGLRVKDELAAESICLFMRYETLFERFRATCTKLKILLLVRLT